ncbi:MAG: monovalent cation:proton antiporter-2 (CPA2) family protein [marine benthic group bacterium]|nr:monovalent cation:proton antiporter-2 (CPA2) family protein [Gemmatimonadota bacterium]MCL7986314.1 monovalent cation:proton antiporter-2 (CPA2) family protein [Gemmatimonadota bacterium]
MHAEGFFWQAFVYLAAAVIAVPIAKRLGLGSVLGYLIAGMVIGPFALGLIGEEGQDVMHFAEFGVVMMLFLIGLELRPTLLWEMRKPILGLGGLQVGITTVLLAGVGVLAGLPWQTAVAVGMTLALSSTAIVLQTLNEKNLIGTDGGQGAFAVLLFQDIAVIPMLALMPLLAVGAVTGGSEAAGHAGEAASHATTWVEGLPAWEKTLVVLAAVAAIVIAGRYLLRPVFRVIAGTRLRELFTATALLLIIGIALLMSQVGLSPALGTFLAGVVLANSEYRHELESEIDPFKGLLLAVFFIAVGASIDFDLIASSPGLILGLVAGLMVIKFVVLLVLGRAFGMGLDQNFLFAFSLAQGGEFAFVLFSYASQNGVVSDEVTAPLIAAVALSMALTPVLMMINEKLIQPRFGTREKVEREPDAMDEEGEVIIAGFGRFGSIVGRLLRANGIEPTVLEFDSDRVEVLRKLGLPVFYGDASRKDLLEAAGAERARLLVVATEEHEQIIRIVETARKHFPNLTILARAAGRPEAYELRDLGVEHVYRETLDTSLRTGIDALRLLGRRGHQAHRAARTFRKHDEASVRELGAMRNDRKAYFSAARERIQALEELLLLEVEGPTEDRDAGWDTESLREDVRLAEGRE